MVSYAMKTFVSQVRTLAPVRLTASTLAVLAVFPFSSVLAQSQSAGTLQEVVVSATRFVAAASTLPFGVSVITKDDIARAGVSTVNEAVIKLLGCLAALTITVVVITAWICEALVPQQAAIRW